MKYLVLIAALALGGCAMTPEETGQVLRDMGGIWGNSGGDTTNCTPDGVGGYRCTSY